MNNSVRKGNHAWGNHCAKAQTFAARAEETLEEVTDPGTKAQTLALLALAHAVLEVTP